MLLSESIILVLFERGAFNANDSLQASYSLIALAIGLVAFMLIKILTPSFFARQEPKKPMYVALASMILNAILAWVLAFYFGYGHVGLAAASSISAFFSVLALMLLLSLEGIYKPSKGWFKFSMRLIFASLCLVLFLLTFNEDPIDLRKITNLEQLLYILKMVIFGMALYLIALRLTGIKFKEFMT